MTKTKKQLRAEAVERLKDAQTDNLEWMLLGDECPNWVNYDTLSYNKAVRERVANLLTDDDANDDSTPEKVVSDPDGGSNVAYIAPDSREKLEADAGELTADYAASGEVCDALHGGIIALLDRQAAITEEKTRYKWVTASAEEIAAWKSKAEKLKEQVYELTAERDEMRGKMEAEHSLRLHWKAQTEELTAERDEWKAKAGEIQQMLDWEEWPDGGEINLERAWVNHMRTIEQLQGQVKELTAERDNLAADLAECEAEREGYREKLSNVMDAVHEAYRAGS